MSITPINFKGKYIVSGSKEEIEQVDNALPKSAKSYKQIDSITVRSKEGKCYRLYATDKDCFEMRKAKKNKNLAEIFKTTKGDILTKISAMAKNIFGNNNDIKLHNADTLINRMSSYTGIHGFNSAEGTLNYESVECLNGETIKYNAFGEPVSISYSKKEEDGVIRRYIENCHDGDCELKSEEFPDGTIKKYIDEKLHEVISPDGTTKTYSIASDYLEKEEYVDGSYKHYDEKGTVINERLSDGTLITYFKDGKIATEKLPDGTTKTYFENGTLKTEKHPDKTYAYYYDNGIVKQKQSNDGSYESRHSNGNPKKIVDENGTSTEYFYRQDGSEILFTISSDTEEIPYYDLDGNKDENVITFKEGNNIVINHPDGLLEKYEIYGEGKTRKKLISTPEGITTEYTYTDDNKFSSRYVTSQDGTVRQYGLNDFLKSIKTPDGTYTEYYRNGSIKETRNPDGSGVGYFYSGNLRFEAESNGNYREYTNTGRIIKLIDDTKYQKWDKRGKLITSIEKNANETIEQNNRLTIVDEEGNERIYYGKKFNNRLAELRNADGSWIKYSPEGVMQSQKTSDGTILKYNSKGLPTHETKSNGEETHYTYNKNGEISSKKLPDGTICIYKNGKLHQEKLPNGTTIKHYLAENEYVRASNSFLMTLRWFFSENTKDVFSIKAKATPRIAALINRIEQNKEYQKLVKQGEDVGDLEYKELTKKEKIAYRSYAKKSWSEAKTEEFKKAHQQAKQVFAIMLEEGIDGIEDEKIKECIQEWKESNPDRYDILFDFKQPE